MSIEKAWFDACNDPDSGSRAESIARLDELTPDSFVALLRSELASLFDETNLLLLAKAHKTLDAAAASKFLLRVALESPFPENRHSAKSAFALLLPADLTALFLGLEQTDRRFARMCVSSLRLPKDDPRVLAACDAFDPSRVMRCTLQLQAPDATCATVAWVDNGALLAEVVRLRPEIAIERYLAQSPAQGAINIKNGKGGFGSSVSFPPHYTDAKLVRLLAHAGESADAVATGLHAACLRHATSNQGNFPKTIGHLLRNHLPDVVVPAFHASKSPDSLAAYLLPRLKHAGYGDLLSFYLPLLGHDLSYTALRKVLATMRPMAKSMRDTFDRLAEWLNGLPCWVWSSENVMAGLSFVAPAHLARYMIELQLGKERGRGATNVHALAVYLVKARVEAPKFALCDRERYDLFCYVLSFPHAPLSTVGPVWEAFVEFTNDSALLYEATLKYQAYFGSLGAVPGTAFASVVAKLTRLDLPSTTAQSNEASVGSLTRPAGESLATKEGSASRTMAATEGAAFAITPWALCILVKAVECDDPAGRLLCRVLQSKDPAMPRDEFWACLNCLTGRSNSSVAAPSYPPPPVNTTPQDAAGGSSDDAKDDEGALLVGAIRGKPDLRKQAIEALLASCQPSLRRDFMIERLRQAAVQIATLYVDLPYVHRRELVKAFTTKVVAHGVFVDLASVSSSSSSSSTSGGSLRSLWALCKEDTTMSRHWADLASKAFPLGAHDAWLETYCDKSAGGMSGGAASLTRDLLDSGQRRAHLLKVLTPPPPGTSPQPNGKLVRWLLEYDLKENCSTAADVIKLAIAMTNAVCPAPPLAPMTKSRGKASKKAALNQTLEPWAPGADRVAQVAATLATYSELTAKLDALKTPAAVLVDVPVLTHVLVGIHPSDSKGSSTGSITSDNDNRPGPAGWSPYSSSDVSNALATALAESSEGGFTKGIEAVVDRMTRVQPLSTSDRDACLSTLVAAVGAAPEPSHVAGGLGLLAKACRAVRTQQGSTAELFRAVLARLEFRNSEDEDARVFVEACSIPVQDWGTLLERSDGLQIVSFASPAAAAHVFHKGQLDLIPRLLKMPDTRGKTGSKSGGKTKLTGRTCLAALLVKCCAESAFHELLPSSADLLEPLLCEPYPADATPPSVLHPSAPVLLAALASWRPLQEATFTHLSSWPAAQLLCFVECLANSGRNPIAVLAALARLPQRSDDDAAFKRAFRNGLEAALRALPLARRQQEIIAALAVANVGTTKALLRLAAANDARFLRRCCAAVWAAGEANPKRGKPHVDVVATMLVLLSKPEAPVAAAKAQHDGSGGNLSAAAAAVDEAPLPAKLFELSECSEVDAKYLAETVATSLEACYAAWCVPFLRSALLRGALVPYKVFELFALRLSHVVKVHTTSNEVQVDDTSKGNSSRPLGEELVASLSDLLLEASISANADCLTIKDRQLWRNVSVTQSPVPLIDVLASALCHSKKAQAANSDVKQALVEGAVRAVGAHSPERAASLFCAVGGTKPTPLKLSSVDDLRALLCNVPDDKWLLPFLTAVARCAATVDSATAIGAAASGHVDIIVASRPNVGDDAFLKLLCLLASRVVGYAAAVAAGSTPIKDEDKTALTRPVSHVVSLVATELDRRSEVGTAATVDLAQLIGEDSKGLEKESAAWLLRNLSMRTDASSAEEHLATLAARVLDREGSSGESGQKFLVTLPLRIQVASPVVTAIAVNLSPAHQSAWLARVLEHGRLPTFLPFNLTKSTVIVEALLADASPQAQLQGLSALCARDSPAATGRLQAVVKTTKSLIVAQHARGLLAGFSETRGSTTAQESKNASALPPSSSTSTSFKWAIDTSGEWGRVPNEPID